MQQLVIRPRWLMLSAGLVATLLAVSISTGMALGQNNGASGQQRGFRGSAQNQNSNACGPAGIGSGGPQFGVNSISNPADEIASALGISVEALAQTLSSGQTLEQLVAAHHLTDQQVADSVTGQLRDQLDQQVANGRLTLMQEDAVLASDGASIAAVLSGKAALSFPASQGNGNARGGFGGQQGGRGRFQGCGG